MSISAQVSDRLRAVFAAHAVAEHQQGVIATVVDQLADGSLAVETVDRAIAMAKDESPNVIRRELAGLLVHYIEYATRDGKLTADELADVRFLNVSFRLRSGEVLKHQRDPICEILDREMNRILLDERVDQVELEYQTELQSALGLGYDEFLHLTRDAFDGIVEGWIARIRADDSVSPEERQIFDERMRQLRTVYPLTAAQKRALQINW